MAQAVCPRLVLIRAVQQPRHCGKHFSGRFAAPGAAFYSEFRGQLSIRQPKSLDDFVSVQVGTSAKSPTSNRAAYEIGRRPAVAAPRSKFQRAGGCLVFPSLPKSRKPKGIIQFIGGAFIGASPDITYSRFIELLAEEGFIIVATPYNITFDHAVLANKIHGKFNDGLSELYNSGLSLAGLTPNDLTALPVYCVGHSMGALMQILIGSLCSERPGQLPKANAIVSFSNKPAADAVPFFEQMGPTLLQAVPFIESSPLTSAASAFAAEAIRAVTSTSLPLPPGVTEDDLLSVKQFLEQIPGVFSQVTAGVAEFKPSPAENRETFALKYSIPNNLLIKFTVDTIDESDALEAPLRTRSELLGGSFQKLILNGTHATPLAQEPNWKVGRVFTPVDAVAQAVKIAALADLRNLAKRIAEWFDTIS